MDTPKTPPHEPVSPRQPLPNGADSQSLVDTCAALREQVKALNDQYADLQANEQLFRALFERSGQPLALIEDGVFTAVNQASLKMLGTPDASTLLGRSPADLSSSVQPNGDDSHTKLTAHLAKALADGYTEFEWELLHAGGRPFTASIRLTAVEHRQRKIVHVSWFDVSAHKSVERELAEYRLELEDKVRERTAKLTHLSEALHLAHHEQKTIFNTATSGLALIKDRVLVRCNRKLHEMFGWQHGEMVGKSTTIWYPDEASYVSGGDGVYEHIWRGETHSREQQLMRHDGSLFWARLTGNAIDIDDPGKGSVWVIDDISNERGVIEQLARARKLAEQTARIKANFIANISHELRTPINAIVGLSELTLTGPLSIEQRDHVEKISIAGEQLRTLVNGVIDYASLDAGNVRIAQAEFDIGELLQRVTAQAAQAAASKGLKFSVTLDDSVRSHVLGDRERIGQVLEQLLSNAVKFTQHGEISLRVSREQGNDEALLQFSLRDTGIGIPQDAAHKLFQRFRQIDESPTRKYLGMGLGLAMSKRLVELMGGRIGFDSTLGQGSTFWFTVLAPARSASTASLKTNRPKPTAPVIKAAPDGAHSHSGQSHNGQLHSGTRILLVEDNPVNQVIGATILRKAGMMVDIAADGAEALAKLQSRSYAAVLMDSQMPVMDGITATREIRKLPGLQALPIIALSANCEPQQVVAYLEAGMNDHLVKPIDGRNLLATLKRWIAQ